MLDATRPTPGKICADCGQPAEWRNLENDFAYCRNHRPPEAIELNVTEHNAKAAVDDPAQEPERVTSQEAEAKAKDDQAER